MNISEAKIRFDAGQLTCALVMDEIMGDGYFLAVGQNGCANINIQRQRGGPASYKTIDAAISAARSIGFKTIRVSLTE